MKYLSSHYCLAFLAAATAGLFPSSRVVMVDAVYVCDGGGGSPITADVNDEIVVPQGTTCAIEGVTVQGSVMVKEGGTILIYPSNNGNCPTIDGPVKCDKCAELQVTGFPPCSGATTVATVNGSIEVTEATVGVGIDHANIGGGVKISNSALNGLSVSYNDIADKIEVIGCDLGGLEVTHNTLTDDIKVIGCDLGDSSSPLTVSYNTIPDNKEVLFRSNSAPHASVMHNHGVNKIRFVKNSFHDDLACSA